MSNILKTPNPVRPLRHGVSTVIEWPAELTRPEDFQGLSVCGVAHTDPETCVGFAKDKHSVGRIQSTVAFTSYYNLVCKGPDTDALAKAPMALDASENWVAAEALAAAFVEQPATFTVTGENGKEVIGKLEAQASRYLTQPVLHIHPSDFYSADVVFDGNGDIMRTKLGSLVAISAAFTPGQPVITGQLIGHRTMSVQNETFDTFSNEKAVVVERIYHLGWVCYVGKGVIGQVATTATAGSPGAFSPEGSYEPQNLEDLRSSDVTADPIDTWAQGQYIELADGTDAHWSGTTWEAGASPGEATGADAGSPGTFTPAGTHEPDDFTELQADITANPATAWTTGQYVVAGDGTNAYWNGTAWVEGIAP